MKDGRERVLEDSPTNGNRLYGLNVDLCTSKEATVCAVAAIGSKAALL